MPISINQIKPFIQKHKNDLLLITIFSIFCIILIFIPSGFENRLRKNTTQVRATILEIDNSSLHSAGIVITGEQILTCKVLNGKRQGEIIKATNRLIGNKQIDKLFHKKDTILLSYTERNGKLIFVKAIDIYRIHYEFILFFLFFILLIALGGFTGVKAFLSFIFTVLLIWKILLPFYLKGYHPILVTLGVLFILTSSIIFLIGGLNKKGLSAFLGAFSGIILTCILALIFNQFFRIEGTVLSHAESLLYTGFSYLNLRSIFLSGIFLAASGAVMDIAMDISTSIKEIVTHNPEISAKKAIKSGLEVGKAVIGTMTTTLLLAYSGSYSAMLMLLITQGTPVINILNLQYIAAEILYTIVGSFGLIAVAPLTAVISGFLLTKKHNQNFEE